MHKILRAIRGIGRDTLGFFQSVGNFSLFLGGAVKGVVTPRWYFMLMLKQMFVIGFLSLPVIGMTAIFTGGVLALQVYSAVSQLNAAESIPSVVVLSIAREPGPVLVGLMVAGRVAASISAELGTMKVTEQITALRTMSANPIKYLVVPRVIASTVTLPLLVFVADIIGIMGGFLASVYSLGLSRGPYLRRTFQALEFNDVMTGLYKAAVFGFIISIIGCYYGYNSRGGAEGVGRATTNAVVVSSILILIANYIMTQIFFV